MANNWRKASLLDVAHVTSGKRPTKVTKTSSTSCAFPVIGGGGPSGFTDAALYNAGVLITGRVGTLGKLFVASEPCWPSDNALVVQPRDESIYSTYLRYALQLVIGEATGMNRGAANPLITQGDLGRLPIPLPPLPEQRAIAFVLGSLDDKIELNRNMTETLEAIAWALFTSWFVNFDPVRAKAEKRHTGLASEIAALFSESFQPDISSQVPEGWRCGTLCDLAAVTSGKRPPSRFSDQNDGHFVPVWGGNGPMAYTTDALINEPILLTGRVGTLGSIFRLSGPIWPSDNTLVLRSSDIWFEYVYFMLRLIDFPSLNRGSTQPLLTQGDLNKQPLIVPPEHVGKVFSDTVKPIFMRIDSANRESLTLTMLRDTLLPKLISGELRVSEAERILEMSA